MLKMKKLTKAIAAFAAFAQLTCVAPVVMAENSDEATAAPAGVTSVYTWDEIKAQKDDGSFKNLTLDGTTNATVSYDKGNDCINMNMNKNENASFKVKDLNVSNGLITISYKLKGASNAGLHLGKLAFNGVNTWKNNTSYGYRDNNCLNYDYYNGSSMTNGWRDAIKLENYDWLDFEYKINLSEHKIAAKITDAKGDPVHSADLGLNPNETYLSGLSFGIQGADFSKVDNFVFSVKDLTITKTQTVVTNVSVTDGAENIAADTPVEITFSTDVVAEKVKNALTVNGGKDFDVTVNGSVATVKLSNPKSNKSYTLKLAEGADVGGYGTIPEEMSVTYKTAKATGITNVITWDKVKDEFAKTSSDIVDVFGHQNSTPATYVKADDTIKLTMGSGQNTRIKIKGFNESNGLITISYKLKAQDTSDWRYGVLDFDGAEKYAYGYRNNNSLNWDYYNGTNYTGIRLESYTDWLNFEYKIDLTSHNIAAKITEANGNPVHSVNLGIDPSVKYFSGIAIGKLSNTNSIDDSLQLKDLTITKTQTVVTNVSVTDGAENVAADTPVEITFSTDVDAEKVKNALTVNDGKDFDVTVNGSVATVKLSNPKSNKSYTLKLAEGADVGGYGTIPEEMSVTYKTAKATGITNVITWDKVKEQNTDGTFKNIKTYTHSKGTIAYNAADKCIDMTVNKGDKSLFTLDLNESNGLINISYKVKATKSAAGVLYGKLAFNGQTDYADEKTYGYRDSNCLNWDSYNADAGKNGNGWDENMKFENYDWLNFEYKIDLANHMVAAKITKADGNEVNSKNIKLNPSETYLSGIRFGMNNNTSDQDGVVVSVKDLNITTTNIIVTDSALDNTAAIDPTADIKLTFNAELTADDFKADVIDNVIVVKDSDGNTVNCTKTVAFSGKVVTISLSGLEGNKTYTLTIPEGSALAFGKLAEEYVGSFTTKAKAEIKGTYTFANKTVTVNGSASLPEEGGIGIIAVYNKADNSLIKVYTKSLDKSSEAQPIGTSVENVTANEVIVKGFVWNSLDSETGMRPIVDDAEFTAAQ